MEVFDVIIIGAGPAGLKCAEALGGSNLKVLLLEKNSEIGPKVCAGGLTGKDVEYLNFPENLIDFKYNKVKLHVNKKVSTVADKNIFAYTVDRKNLGQWQLKKLEQYKNIEVRTNSNVSEIEKDSVIVNRQKIGYKFLVGADGFSSIVKRYLGVNSKSSSIAIQYIVPTREYKDLEVFCDSKLFSQWYAWIFPHNGCVSIGCGCDPKVLPPEKLMANFRIWLNKNKIDTSKGKYEASAIGCDYQGYQFKNIFLVGDAGGFGSKLTGEGIYPALISGEEVAKILLNPNYKPIRIGHLLRVKKKHNQLTNILVKSGSFRTSLFFTGMLLFKIPYFKKKMIGLLT